MRNGYVLWFTGLSGSGKTTIATKLELKLRDMGTLVERLDGDILRETICKDLGFTKEDRIINIGRTGFIAELLSRNGVQTLVSLISPYSDSREKLKNRIANFYEIYVHCPIEYCIARDVKGLYTKALQNKTPNFTGVTDIYEVPRQPDLTIDTHQESVEESVNRVLEFLYSKHLILPSWTKEEFV